ncbi:MAG: Asd/ArgC dimerization domain-containing protein, partial [Myxococcota bacterium]
MAPAEPGGARASLLDYGDSRVPVDDLSDEGIDGVDALLVAVPPEAGKSAADLAAHRGVPMVDCSGAFADDRSVPLVVPWINPEGLGGDLHRGLVAIPDPAAVLLASVLGPLQRAGITGAVEATVLVPASFQGKAGIEELSRQVVALFNSGTPPRKVFPNGLAFDLLPALDTPEDDGWTARERSVAAQTARVAGMDGPVQATLVGVPVFSGISANIVLYPTRAAPLELVLRILADGGVHVPESAGLRYLPRPRRVEGRPFAHVGRVRLGADGRSLHLWTAMDNLRTTATAAVATAGVLLG